MNVLPNNDRAILDIRKIEDYCLNPAHPRGQHKARVFREALGVARTDAAWLQRTLLEAVRHCEAIELQATSSVAAGALMLMSCDTASVLW